MTYGDGVESVRRPTPTWSASFVARLIRLSQRAPDRLTGTGRVVRRRVGGRCCRAGLGTWLRCGRRGLDRTLISGCSSATYVPQPAEYLSLRLVLYYSSSLSPLSSISGRVGLLQTVYQFFGLNSIKWRWWV